MQQRVYWVIAECLLEGTISLQSIVCSRLQEDEEQTMIQLSPEEALIKRQQLVTQGFCVVEGVLPTDLLKRLKAYTDDLLTRHVVDHKHRYQGSDFHVGSQRKQDTMNSAYITEFSSLVDELTDLPEALEACRLLGLEGQRPDDVIIILSKPPFGPPLYWHQDMMNWNHPEASSPWPTRVFLSYYMTDTTLENGCLRVIPGTHLKRIPLHEKLPAAHCPEIQALTDLSHPAFLDHPDAIDIPVKAGDLVINDARLLHAARANTTAEQRTLVLQWHSIFPYPQVPTWWTGDIPDELHHFDPSKTYETTRHPGERLK